MSDPQEAADLFFKARKNDTDRTPKTSLQNRMQSSGGKGERGIKSEPSLVAILIGLLMIGAVLMSMLGVSIYLWGKP